MRILAIGATGFIGPPLVRRLVKHGHDVVVFHRGETDADLPDIVQHFHGDRNDLSEHRDAFEGIAPDVVIDVVPYTEAQAEQVVEVFEGIADRLVAVSSSDVYRNYDGWRGLGDHDPDPVPLDEEAPLREDLYPYRGYEGLDFEYAEDYDKILVERVLMNADGLAGTVLRLPAVYGPGNTQHRLAPHLRRMDDDRPAILMDEGQAAWRWTHGYVENVAAAIATAATDQQASDRLYNVGEAETPTEAERVRHLARVVGWGGDVVPVPSSELLKHLQAPGDWRYELETDTRRLRDELGYEAPVAMDEALRRTVEWERAHQSDAPAPDYEAEDAVLNSRS
ncbi:NAD-dependent epimerase/dehydratase family protein [Longibacter sp.]|uniref:NAD-dependent epimerase/dehydratase family protein n=1 Tax=Longibacter sp. TaxID=2045415 RepID=UPI003EB7B895